MAEEGRVMVLSASTQKRKAKLKDKQFYPYIVDP